MPFFTPRGGIAEVKKGTHDDSILLDSPYLVSWIGHMLKVLTEAHPHGHLFDLSFTDFLEQLRISRRRLGLDDVVPHQMRHSGVSIELNSKLRSHQEAQKRGRWRQHLSMARYEKHARLEVTASWYPPAPRWSSESCSRPLRGRHLESCQDRSLPAIRLKSRYAVQLFSCEKGWACMSAHRCCCPLLGFGQVPGEPGRHPTLAATVLSRGGREKRSECPHRCTVFESARFTQVQRNA